MRDFSMLLAAALLSHALLLGAVRRIRIPQDGICPDVVIGPSSAVYLVFGRGQNALFSVSKHGGKTFSRPVRLNTVPDTVLVGHERGPKIAVGKNEVLHVIWMSTHSDQLDYTRSSSRERPFSPPRNLLDRGTHLDGATVAADEKGNVLISWLDARLPAEPQNPLSMPVFSAHSRDNGLTFSKNQAVQGDQPLRACSCCALKSVAGSDGDFDIAFRGAYHNIRDSLVARVPAGRGDPQATVSKIGDQEWRFNGCPMSGPFLTRTLQPGELWAAWMSDGRVYYSQSLDEGKHYADLRTPGPSKRRLENHPIILVNRERRVFFAWEEGRTVCWQITDQAGRVLGSGDAGSLPENSKATGFVDRKGDFCLVF